MVERTHSWLLFLLESLAAEPTLSWPREMLRYGAQVLSRKNLDLVLDGLPDFPRSERVSL